MTTHTFTVGGKFTIYAGEIVIVALVDPDVTYEEIRTKVRRTARAEVLAQLIEKHQGKNRIWDAGQSDRLLGEYLEKIAEREKLDGPKAAADYLTNREWEARNRRSFYPDLAACLKERPLSIPKLKELVTTSPGDVILGGHAAPRSQVNDFLKKSDQAAMLIEKLIGDRKTIPKTQQIDEFIEASTKLSFHKRPSKHELKGRELRPQEIKPNRAQAALFASLLLAAVFPDDFVDYRKGHWEELAKRFSLEPLKLNRTAGQSIEWAGRVAKQFAALDTFKSYFPQDYTNWTVAGLARLLKNE